MSHKSKDSLYTDLRKTFIGLATIDARLDRIGVLQASINKLCNNCETLFKFDHNCDRRRTKSHGTLKENCLRLCERATNLLGLAAQGYDKIAIEREKYAKNILPYLLESEFEHLSRLFMCNRDGCLATTTTLFQDLCPPREKELLVL